MLAFAILTACAEHVVLLSALTAPGSSYVCRRAAHPASCRPDPSSVPADATVSGSVFAILPAACAGAFDPLVIRHPGADDRQVALACGGAWYACPASEAPGTCTVAEPLDGLVIARPEACTGGVSAVFLDRLGGPFRRARVTCAAPEHPPGSTP